MSHCDARGQQEGCVATDRSGACDEVCDAAKHGRVSRAVRRVCNSLDPTSQGERGEFVMSTTQEEKTGKVSKVTPPESDPTKIDRNAPPGLQLL